MNECIGMALSLSFYVSTGEQGGGELIQTPTKFACRAKAMHWEHLIEGCP